MADSIRSKIRKRLEKYLELDKDGVRHTVLRILLRVKSTTSEKMYKLLRRRKFNVSLKSVAAMLGTISSKLGILRARKDSYKSAVVYTVKEQYIAMVKTCLRKSATPTPVST